MSKFLDAFKAEIDTRENANVFFIGEYHDGKIETMRLQHTNPCQDTYSVSKAFVVTAIGMLVDRGLLTTDETLTDILADELPETYHPVWTKTSVEMLLLHKVVGKVLAHPFLGSEFEPFAAQKVVDENITLGILL